MQKTTNFFEQMDELDWWTKFGGEIPLPMNAHEKMSFFHLFFRAICIVEVCCMNNF